MKTEQFDLAIQILGGGRYSNPFIRRLGARLTVDCRSPEDTPLDRWIPYRLATPAIIQLLSLRISIRKR